ncbi:MAG: hypothetical protein PVF27_08350, partial [Gemmatimonadales bacterium]
AAQFSDRLPSREQTLVDANHLYQTGDLVAIDTLRAFVQRYPDDAEGWYQLAEAQYRARHLLALDDQELYAPFDRVFEIDSTLTPALIHALELSVADADSARFVRYLRALESGSAPGPAERFRTARRVIDAGPDSVVPILVRTARSTGYDPMQLAIDVLTLLVGARRTDRLPLVQAADTLLATLSERDARRLDVLALKVRLLNGAGRSDAARDAAGQVVSDAPLEAARLLLSPAVAGASGMAGAVADGVRALDAVHPFSLDEEQAVRYWRALVAIRLNDLAEATRIAGAGTAAVSRTGADPYRGLFRAVRGWTDLVRGDTTSGVAALRDGLREAGYWPWVTRDAAPLRLVLARTLVARPSTREEGMRLLRLGIRPDAPDLARLAAGELARAFIAAGNSPEATRRYLRQLDYWRGSDSTLQLIIDEARRREH